MNDLAPDALFRGLLHRPHEPRRFEFAHTCQERTRRASDQRTSRRRSRGYGPQPSRKATKSLKTRTQVRFILHRCSEPHVPRSRSSEDLSQPRLYTISSRLLRPSVPLSLSLVASILPDRQDSPCHGLPSAIASSLSVANTWGLARPH